MPITNIQKTQYSTQILPQGMPSGNVGMPVIQDNFFKNSKNEKTEQIGSKNGSPLYKTTIENANKKTIYCNSKMASYLEKYGLTVIIVDEKHELYEKNLALLKEAIDELKEAMEQYDETRDLIEAI